MIGSTGVEEPACGLLHGKQNFCFGDALQGEDVRILRSDPFSRTSQTVVVHFFGSGGLSSSLSLFIFVFEGTTSRSDVSTLLAGFAHTCVPEVTST